MAQRKSDTSEDDLRKRVKNLETLLSKFIHSQNDSSGTSPSSTGESSSKGSRIDSTRKRSSSVEGDGGGKKKRSEGESFECTLCDGKYQKEWALFRHYRVTHREESPERVHQENLAKKAGTKKSKKKYSNKSEKQNRNVNKPEGVINCKLCESTFNSASARNSHYTGKHRIRDEKLLFSPDGSALVESSLEHQIRKNPQWFKTVVKRNMSPRACKLCEAELDIDDLKCHYERDHRVMQMSKVKTLIRLNNTDIEHVAAIEKCKHCSDTFTDTKALEIHVATVHTGLFIECKFCNKTFEKKIYNDHVKKEHAEFYFKKSDVKNTPTKVSEPNKSTTEQKDAEKREDTERPQEATISARRVSFKSQSTQEVPLMYICDGCNLVTSSYDNVVAHSQDHILNNMTKEPEICDKCELKFDVDFHIHKEMHLSNDDLDRDSFRFVSYDYKHLTDDKWLDMFKSSTKSKVSRIISASIYFSTRCVRLKLRSDCKEASPQFTLFECMTCNNFVDPKSIESHVGQRNSCADQTFSHQCVKCTKTFYTQEAHDEHVKTHDIPDSDSRYRRVLFNKPSDFIFNKALLEHAGKSVLIEKERLLPERRVIDEDVAKARTPANKVTVVTSQTNRANPKEGTDEENKDANEAKGVTNKGNKIANQHEMTINPKTVEGKAADVYKCACGLCFHRINLLLKHMLKCSTDSKIVKVTCTCGLVFDVKNFVYHCKAHCDDITTFNVKGLVLVDKIKVDVKGTAEEFRKDYRKKLSKAIYEVNKQKNSDVNLKQHEKVSKRINSSNEHLTPKNTASESNDLIQTHEENVDKSAAKIKKHESIDIVNKINACSEKKKLYKELGKADAESSGESQAVDKMVQNSINLKESQVNTTEPHKNMLTDVLSNIPKSKKPLEVVEKDSSFNNNKNNTLESENTQENKTMVETTIEVELKENTNSRTFNSKRNIEEQPKLCTLNSTEQINERHQITTQTLGENESTKDKIKEVHKNTIVSIQDLMDDDNNEINTSHITDDSNVEDYDEDELLREPENEVNDSIISNDVNPIASEIDLKKKKLESLFNTSSNTVKQELIDYLLNHDSKNK